MRADAVLMAGSREEHKDQPGDRMVEKPYLCLGGRSLVEGAVEALLASESIGRVYVVGDRRRLQAVLQEPGSRCPDRLRLVEQGRDLVDSAYRAFFRTLLPDHGIQPPAAEHFQLEETGRFLQGEIPKRDLPAVFVASDLPFLTADAVDEFVGRVPADTALALGLVDYQLLEGMFRATGLKHPLERWKLGAIHLRRGPVRINNLLWARPLRLDANLYRLVQLIYENRGVLQLDGRVDRGNWWSITRDCLAYGRRAAGGLRMLRGLSNIAPMALAAMLARFLGGRRRTGWLAWPFVQFLGERDLGFAAGLLLGARAGLVICSHPGPALDTDVEDSYRFLADDQEAAYRAILDRLKRLT